MPRCWRSADRRQGSWPEASGGDPLVLFEATFLSLCRVDVDFKVDGVRTHCFAFDIGAISMPSMIMWDGLRLVLHYWLSDIVFLG